MVMYWPVVCCLRWLWEEIGGTKRELLALQSAFKFSFGLFNTNLHFFTHQAPTAAPGATKEVESALLILACSVLFVVGMGAI